MLIRDILYAIYLLSCIFHQIVCVFLSFIFYSYSCMNEQDIWQFEDQITPKKGQHGKKRFVCAIMCFVIYFSIEWKPSRWSLSKIWAQTISRATNIPRFSVFLAKFTSTVRYKCLSIIYFWSIHFRYWEYFGYQNSIKETLNWFIFCTLNNFIYC